MRLCVGLLGSVFAVLLATASCSDDPAAPASSADAGSEGGSLSGEVTAFIADLCGAYEPCCKGAPGAESCATATEALARSATFDSARAAACIEALRGAAAGASFCLEPPSATACAAVFKGAKPKAPGSTCKQASDCSNGDDGDGICVLQKCRRAARGKEGDACIGTWIAGEVEPLFGLAIDAGALCSSE